MRLFRRSGSDAAVGAPVGANSRSNFSFSARPDKGKLFARRPGLSLCNVRSMAYIRGMNAQSPIVSEFPTSEEAAAYERWLHGKVAASLGDGRPSVAHDEVMREIKAIIEDAKHKPAC